MLPRLLLVGRQTPRRRPEEHTRATLARPALALRWLTGRLGSAGLVVLSLRALPLVCDQGLRVCAMGPEIGAYAQRHCAQLATAPRVARERCAQRCGRRTCTKCAARIGAFGARSAAVHAARTKRTDAPVWALRAPLTAHLPAELMRQRCAPVWAVGLGGGGSGGPRLLTPLPCTRHTCSTLSLRASLERCRRGFNLANTGSAARTHLPRAMSLLALSFELMRPLVFM